MSSVSRPWSINRRMATAVNGLLTLAMRNSDVGWTGWLPSTSAKPYALLSTNCPSWASATWRPGRCQRTIIVPAAWSRTAGTGAAALAAFPAGAAVARATRPTRAAVAAKALSSSMARRERRGGGATWPVGAMELTHSVRLAADGRQHEPLRVADRPQRCGEVDLTESDRLSALGYALMPAIISGISAEGAALFRTLPVPTGASKSSTPEWTPRG